MDEPLQLVCDRFEVLQRLGEGTYSVVYKCIDHHAQKRKNPVAVKFIRHLDISFYRSKSMVPKTARPKVSQEKKSQSYIEPLCEPTAACASMDEPAGATMDGSWTTWKKQSKSKLKGKDLTEPLYGTDSEPSDEESTTVFSYEDALQTTKPMEEMANVNTSMSDTQLTLLCPFLPKSALREIGILAALIPHPNIITLHEVILPDTSKEPVAPLGLHASRDAFDPAARTEAHQDAAATLHKLTNAPSLCLIFENIPNGDLRQYMTRKPEFFTPNIVKKLFHQLLLAVTHLHRSGVLHRDIKPHNILIDAEQLRIKLTDFNLATVSTCDTLTWTDKLRNPLTNAVVTLWYRSPEVLLGSTTYDAGIDTWALGCVLWEMAHPMEGPIFRGSNEVEQLMRIFQLLGTPGASSSKKLESKTEEKRHSTLFQRDHRGIHKNKKYVDRMSEKKESTFPSSLSTPLMHHDVPPIETMPYFSRKYPKWQSARNDALHAPGLSPSGADLLFSLLEVNPRRRISAMAALSHPWFWED